MFSRVAALELQKMLMKEQDDEDEPDFMIGYDSPMVPGTPGDSLSFMEGNEFQAYAPGQPKDYVPSNLFAANIADQGLPATLTAQPVALRTAMK